MLAIVSIFGFITLASATLPFKITDCSTSPRKIVHIENVHLSQDPIKIPGNETVSADVMILQSIAGTGHYNVSWRVQRHGFNGWVEAPCFHDFGIFASCTYDLCTLLSGKHYQNTTHHCPIEIAQTSPEFECACPFPVGAYHLNPLTVHIDNLASYLKWLAKGDYKAEAKIVDTTTHEEVGCFIIQATTASDCVGISCIFGKRHISENAFDIKMGFNYERYVKRGCFQQAVRFPFAVLSPTYKLNLADFPCKNSNVLAYWPSVEYLYDTSKRTLPPAQIFEQVLIFRQWMGHNHMNHRLFTELMIDQSDNISFNR